MSSVFILFIYCIFVFIWVCRLNRGPITELGTCTVTPLVRRPFSEVTHAEIV